MHGIDRLLSRLKEIESLIRTPSVIGHYASASSLAGSIAKRAPTESIANLAVRLAAELDALKVEELPLSPSNIHINKTLSKLRLALERAKEGVADRPAS